MSTLNPMVVRNAIFLALFAVVGAVFFSFGYTNEQIQTGNQYKIVGSIYLSGIYQNLNDRQLNKKMAIVSLTAVRFTGPEVAFQLKVPIGTTITIVGPAPKRLSLPFFANRYFVQLDPDMSRGLDVVLELNRGLEGDLDGLNPKLFKRLE